jgi:hypothetical protein
VHVSRQVDHLSALLDQFAAGEEELRRPIRSDEQISREQLREWANRFGRWLGGSAGPAEPAAAETPDARVK